MTKMYLVCNKIESSYNYVQYSLTIGPNIPEWDASMDFQEVDTQYLAQEIPLVDEDVKVCVIDTLALLGFKPEDISEEFLNGREFLIMDIDVHRPLGDPIIPTLEQTKKLCNQLSEEVKKLAIDLKQSSLNLGGELKSII